jgi:putative oxidoreductase
MNERLQQYGALAARLGLAAIFVHAGWGKLAGLEGAAAYVASRGLPAPELLTLIAGATELLGGLALVTGFGARWAALALALFLVPTTVLFHNPAGLEAAAAQMQTIHVYKNLAIAGGLLAIASFGAGSLALRLAARRRQALAPARLAPRSPARG